MNATQRATRRVTCLVLVEAGLLGPMILPAVAAGPTRAWIDAAETASPKSCDPAGATTGAANGPTGVVPEACATTAAGRTMAGPPSVNRREPMPLLGIVSIVAILVALIVGVRGTQ